MVRLSQIYTKTGDDGTTGLGDGSRIAKGDLRVESYGTVDEANAAIGLCVIAARAAAVREPHAAAIAALLTGIQNDLFDVGADLCCPVAPAAPAQPGGTGAASTGSPPAAAAKPAQRLRVTAAQTRALELAIDEHNDRLKPLDSFVLPGGSPLSAHLHLARTITRRAERRVSDLILREPGAVNHEAMLYLNRLSDLLFVLARVANDDGRADVKWVPGGGGSRPTSP